ncbi:MAG: cytochrome c biogenesis protein CcdA [Anaerolineaceae bacterium]|nr:cytochrome c biogenesis protein CcdA [Anaerolineaceae bacterium]
MTQRENKAFRLSILFSLIAFFSLLLPQIASASQSSPQGIGPTVPTPTVDVSNAKVHGYYFYSNTCAHCIDILNEIVYPLEEKYPGEIDLRLLELGTPAYYQALLKVETAYNISAGDRGLPTVVLGDQILIGEEQNRADLLSSVEAGLAGDGITFPAIEGLDPVAMVSVPPTSSTETPLACSPDDPSACEVNAPIYMAYFYQVGCKECNRAHADLQYLQSQYPQLIIEEFNIYEDTDIANWMAQRTGRENDFKVPAVFIGDKAWIGEAEITSQNIAPYLDTLKDSGSAAFWKGYDAATGTSALMNRFKSMGWLAVVFAGLIDGLNPCAFATIIFFISYLTLSGRKGKEVILTGASFTLGVFIAYLAVGLGFYKVLDVVKESLAVIGKIVYALTAVLCLTLAVISILDFFKARKGQIGDMALNLPEPLRKRINKTIREGRKASSYYLGAFVTGILISFLELACTGQIYLPTIIFMSTMPELRARAISYLVLYNLMFIVPLIVVFILAYFGTTSKDLTEFLKKHAAAVKIGMTIVFLTLGIWLLISLFA